MRPFLFFLLLLMIATSLFAQDDTAVVYYNRKGEPTTGDDAVKFGLQIKQGDHYKKLMVDARDNKVQFNRPVKAYRLQPITFSRVTE